MLRMRGEEEFIYFWRGGRWEMDRDLERGNLSDSRSFFWNVMLFLRFFKRIYVGVFIRENIRGGC